MECCGTEVKKHKHPDHGSEISRINRAVGQLEGVKKMIEEGRYCPDILTQLRAACSAIRSVEGNILERHLESCVDEALSTGSKKDRQRKLAELKEIFLRF